MDAGPAEEIRQLKARIQQLEQQQQLSSGDFASNTPQNFDLSSSAPNHTAVPRDVRRHSATPRMGRMAHASHASGDHTMKRSKTASHSHSRRISIGTASMARSNSAVSTQSTPVNPFTSNGSGPVTPPTVHSSSQPTDNHLILDYWSHNDQQQPANSKLVGEALHPTTSSRQRRRPQVSTAIESSNDLGVGMNIQDFLQSRGESMHSAPLSASTTTSRHGQFLSPTDIYMPMSGIPSSCGSLTEAATLETPMSRQNSNLFDNMSLSDPINMMRIESQGSNQADALAGHDLHSIYTVSTQSSLGKRPTASDSDFLGVGANLPTSFLPVVTNSTAMDRIDSTSSTHSDTSLSRKREFSNYLANEALGQHLSMERSISASSAKSAASLNMRAKEALYRQNHNARTAPTLQPKPLEAKTHSSSHHHSSKRGDGKKEIPRPKYERPKHPKVKCTQCNDYPDGFRGEHELRRHTEAKHKGVVKKWICVDPNLGGMGSGGLTAVNPLEKCKQCNGKKRYGAYYNAAAHLRRTHFKKKPARKGQNKGGNASPAENDEKRGGKGGGDWPPMNELKNWMREIQVPVNDSSAFNDDFLEDEVDNEAMEQAFNMSNPEIYSQFDMAADMDVGDFGGNDAFPVSAMYPTPISSADFNVYEMSQNMATAMMDSHGSPYASSSAPTVTANMYSQEGAYDGMAEEHHPEFDFGMRSTNMFHYAACRQDTALADMA